MSLQRQKIWDPLTRLWHWLLVASVTLGWVFGEFMNFDTIQWHFYCGYVILALVAIRCFRALVGPANLRLSTLLPAPSQVLAYLKSLPGRSPSGTPGHNPLGALSVLAMLILKEIPDVSTMLGAVIVIGAVFLAMAVHARPGDSV